MQFKEIHSMFIVGKKAIKVNLKKIFKMLLTLNVLQIVFAILISFWIKGNTGEEYYVLIYVSLVLALINSLSTVWAYYMLNNLNNKSLKESIKNLENLNTTLRAQRHDYLNQLQVVYGLMELEEYDEARKYLEPVFKDIMRVSKALKTAHPAINALLQAKMQMAEEKKIEMYLEVKSNLKEFQVEPWEMCKVLANIIDNGMTALEKCTENRILSVEIGEDLSHYFFNIYNNGPQIPRENMKRLFEEGFTTKKEGGHGMGLFISKHIIQRFGGTIQVDSTSEQTRFEIRVPKV